MAKCRRALTGRQRFAGFLVPLTEKRTIRFLHPHPQLAHHEAVSQGHHDSRKNVAVAKADVDHRISVNSLSRRVEQRKAPDAQLEPQLRNEIRCTLLC